MAMSMSPPDAPTTAALGCPVHSRLHGDAVLIPRQTSLPPPRPLSEPRKTSLSRDTCTDGSPSGLPSNDPSAHPEEPPIGSTPPAFTSPSRSLPKSKLPTVPDWL